MIRVDTLVIPEILTRFNIEKINFDPFAESTWYLKYQNISFIADEKMSQTKESDQELIGGEIEAQINMDIFEVLQVQKQEKGIIAEGSWLTVTGILEEEILYSWEQEGGYYIIDSIFKVEVLPDNPLSLQKGDWVTVKGLADLILPRGTNIVPRN